MAVIGYLRLEEKGNHPVTGECTEAGHVGWTELSAFEYEVRAPVDPGTGAIRSSRTTAGFRIVKEIDRLGPLLLTHLTSNESVTIEVMLSDRADKSLKPVRKFLFTDAQVVEIRNAQPDKFDSAHANAHQYQSVRFIFQKVEDTRPPGKTAHDDWR